MRAIDQERRLLLSFMQDQAEAAVSASSRPAPEAAVPKPASNSANAPQDEDSMPIGNCNANATVSMYSHASEAATAAQSSHASMHAGATHSGLQCSVSDDTALPGSLRQQFAVSVPAQHTSSACSAWRLQPSPLKGESSQTPSASHAISVAGPAQRHQGAAGITAHAEPSPETHSASHADGPCKLKIVSSASGSSTLYQTASMPIATSNGWHLRASSQAVTVSRRKHNMYAEQQAYWQKKEALCPTIKNCIQEVRQLRAQLSADSLQLSSLEQHGDSSQT